MQPGGRDHKGRGFNQRGFDIVAIFDNDATKVGQPWNGLIVLDVADLERECAALKPDIAVIVTPGDAAQAIADRLVKCAVAAILNFAPVPLQVPDDVTVKAVNLVLEMEALSYALASK